MEEIEAGNLNVQLKYESRDELGQLSDSVRGMVDSLKAIIHDEDYLFAEMGNGISTSRPVMRIKICGRFYLHTYLHC